MRRGCDGSNFEKIEIFGHFWVAGNFHPAETISCALLKNCTKFYRARGDFTGKCANFQLVEFSKRKKGIKNVEKSVLHDPLWRCTVIINEWTLLAQDNLHLQFYMLFMERRRRIKIAVQSWVKEENK